MLLQAEREDQDVLRAPRNALPLLDVLERLAEISPLFREESDRCPMMKAVRKLWRRFLFFLLRLIVRANAGTGPVMVLANAQVEGPVELKPGTTAFIYNCRFVGDSGEGRKP
jgi:hypothetical protein